MTLSRNILHALLRQDFASFIHKAFKTINPGTKFISNWHIDLLISYLKKVTSGEIKRLIINIPPRNLKSLCISVAWPAWLLAQDPTYRIIVSCYSQILSIKHSLDCRLIMESGWYKSLFINTVLSNQHNQKSKFITTKQGFRFATSVGGSITGEGGDILIIDDPHNPTHIHSTKARKKVIDWYEQTFSTRLNDSNKGAIVIVMQRLHEEDLTGYLTAANQNHWTILKIPVIADKDYHFEINKEKFPFLQGQLLHSLRNNKDTLLQLEAEIGSKTFAAQYMQNPLKQHGLLPLENLRYYSDRPKKFESIIQSWDTAIKISDTADYSVCTTWGILNKQYYLLDMLRKKLSYPNLKITAEKLITKWDPKSVLIEDKNSGQSLIQDLQLKYLHNSIVPQKPKLDKVTRFASVTPLFNIVLLPKNIN